VTLDYAGDAMYLQRSGEWAGFPRERAGLGTHLIDGRLKVTYVSPDGPAKAAGLKAGDEIVAVNGQPITSEYYATPLSRWAEGVAGSTVELGRTDGSTAKIRLADYY
jgi:S1-C subfamily serine protease